MAATIEIPKYRIVIPNAVWQRVAEPITQQENEAAGPAVHMLVLSSVSVPYDKDIVKVLQQGAKDVLSGTHPSNSDKLLKMMQRVPPPVLTDIVEGEKKSLDTYLQLNSQHSGHNWELVLKLEDDRLPSRALITNLLKAGTWGSDVFQARGHFREYSKVAEAVEGLYAGLTHPDQLKLTHDETESMIESSSAQVLKTYVTCLMAKDFLSHLPDILPALRMGNPCEQSTEPGKTGKDDYSVN